MSESTGTAGQSSRNGASMSASIRALTDRPGGVVRAVVRPAARLVDIAAAGAYLGVSRRSVFRMLDAGALRPVRLPGVRALRFDLRDLEQLVEGAKR